MLLNRQAAWYSHLHVGTVTWVDSLARWGAETSLSITTRIGRTCEPQIAPLLVKAYLIHVSVTKEELASASLQVRCKTALQRKQLCELNVFGLREVLMRGFQSIWTVTSWF